MLDDYKAFWMRAFDFHGRCLRGELWWAWLINAVIYVVLEMIFPGSGMVFAFVQFIPNLSVTFRRLHDTDRTAWWMLIGFVPVVGIIVLIFFCASKGTIGDNRYGPRPV